MTRSIEYRAQTQLRQLERRLNWVPVRLWLMIVVDSPGTRVTLMDECPSETNVENYMSKFKLFTPCLSELLNACSWHMWHSFRVLPPLLSATVKSQLRSVTHDNLRSSPIGSSLQPWQRPTQGLDRAKTVQPHDGNIHLVKVTAPTCNELFRGGLLATALSCWPATGVCRQLGEFRTAVCCFLPGTAIYWLPGTYDVWQIQLYVFFQGWTSLNKNPSWSWSFF